MRPLLLALILLCNIALGAAEERIRTDAANLRAEPLATGRIITALRRGEAVTLLEWSGNYAQVRVRSTGLTGWVYGPAQGWPQPSPPAGAQRPPGPAQAPAPTHPPMAASAAPAPAQAPPRAESGDPIAEWFRPAPDPRAEAAAPPAPAPRQIPRVPESAGTAHAPLTVGELRLAMDPKEAEILFRKPPNDRSSLPVAVLEDGKRLEGRVTVRGAFSRNFLKKSLIVSLPRGSEWKGQRRLSLTALATDATRVRDFLAWRLIHHLGMAAPEVRYLDLYLNDEYVGLYLLIEWIDERVFARYGLGADGEFYQPNDLSYCGDFTEIQLPRFADCWEKLSPRDGDLARLRALNQEILDTPAERFDALVESRFDAQSLIDWLVVVTLTQSGDTFNKNYFLYWSRARERWTVIPWDFDQSFGRVGDEASPYPLSIWNDYFVYHYPPELGVDNPLKEKTLRNPRLYARYKARIAELFAPGPCERPAGCGSGAAGWFHPSSFDPLLDAVAAVAAPRGEKFPSPGAERFPLQVEAVRKFNEWRFRYLNMLILEPTVFDTPLWLPYTAYAPFNPLPEGATPVRRSFPLTMIGTRDQPAGDARVFYLDAWMARPLAVITTRALPAPARITVEVESEQPPAVLPPGITAADCIERTWHLSVKTPGRALAARVELDWIQESSTHHELGPGVRDEAALELWAGDGTRWTRLASAVNPISNALVADEVPLEAARPLRLVACVPSR